MPATTTFVIPDELYEKLRKASYEKKISQGEIIRQALEQYLENHNKLE